MKNILWWGAAGVIGYGLYQVIRKGNALNKLGLRIVKVLPSLTGGRFLARLDLQATNQTGADIEINGVAGSLRMGSTFLGNVISTLPKQIPAFSSQVIQVDIDLGTLNVLQVVADFIAAPAAGNISLTFDGVVNYSGLNVPVVLTYNVVN